MNEKALRKAVRKAVASYKNSMLGGYTCTDVGGRRWWIEYSVLVWHHDSTTKPLGYWNEWSSSRTQRDLFADLKTLKQDGRRYAVDVRLVCEWRDNQNCKLKLNGEPETR